MSNPVPPIDGGRLRRLREDKGFTQGQLAYQSDVDQSVISRLEKNRQKGVRLDTVRRIAAALDTTVGELSGGRVEALSVPAAVEQDARDLAELGEAERRAVRGVILAFKLRQPVPIRGESGGSPTTEPNSEAPIISTNLRRENSPRGVILRLPERAGATYALRTV